MRSKLIYIGLSYSIQVLNVILNLIFMQRLPMSILGDLAIAKVWLQTFDYTHLGSRFALDRFLPVTKRSEQRQLYLWITLATVFSGSLLVIFFSMIIEKVNYVVLSFCLVGMSLAIGNVIKAYFRATSDIKSVNNIVMRLYCLPLAISVGVATFDYEIFLLVYPISFIAALVYFFITFSKNKRHFLLWSHRTRVFFRKMSSVSGLLFINSIIVYATLVIDRLFVDWTLGRDALGQYSIVMFVFASLFTVPSILTELIFPKIIRKVVHERSRLFLKEILFVSLATLLMILVVNAFMYLFVANYTSHKNLLPLMQLASLAVLPYSVTSILSHVFNGLDYRLRLLKINALLLVCYFFVLSVISAHPALELFLYAKIAFSILTSIFLGVGLIMIKELKKDD